MPEHSGSQLCGWNDLQMHRTKRSERLSPKVDESKADSKKDRQGCDAPGKARAFHGRGFRRVFNPNHRFAYVP